ncbi:hypothetical protein Tco_0602115 [Tanacetum coccineum]
MEEGRMDRMIIRRNSDELKTKLKKIRTKIINLQKKQLGQKDKIAFAYYGISNLEQIIEKIQAPVEHNSAIASASNPNNLTGTPAVKMGNYKEFIISQPFCFNGRRSSLEKSINQSDIESYDSIGDKSSDDSDLGTTIQCIDPVNTPYSDAQKTVGTDEVKSEHMYLASANEIDEKKPEMKDLPHHLEYTYLHGNKLFPIIISFKLSEKEKRVLLQVLEKRKGAIAWKC